MRFTKFWQKISWLIFSFIFFGQNSFADTIIINIQNIPPLPGMSPGSCWNYGGSTPASIYSLGVTFYGDVLNAGGSSMNPDGSTQLCSNPDFSQFGPVLLDNLGAVGMSFNPNILPNVSSVSVSGVTSFCQIFFHDPTTGAFVKNPDGTLMVAAGHPDVTVTTSFTGGSVEGVPQSSTLLLNAPSEASVTVNANTGTSISSIFFGVGPLTSECLAGTNGNGEPTSGLISGTITIQTGSTIDLAIASPLVISQNGNAVSAGGTVSPGQPIQVMVPVSGFGFNSNETRTTLVTLHAGSQSYSQTINLADIKSAGTLNVPFNVIFGQQDLGMQTITATVDPGNVLNETNFSNNMGSVQVVIAKYKLTASVQNSDGTWSDVPDSGGTFTVNPSDFIFNTNVSTLGLGSGNPSQPQTLKLGCVDISTYPPTPISGCQFQIEPLALGNGDPYSNGGHTHTDSRPFILGGTESLFAYDGSFHLVDTTGQSLTYWPPIVSGDIAVNVKGSDSYGNPIQGAPSITFRIRLPNLSPLTGAGYSFKCDLDPNNSNCMTTTYLHENFYNVTSQVNAQMSSIGEAYNLTFPNDQKLIINDASLGWGGLYDEAANTSSIWSPPHKYHRQGTDVDLNSKAMPNDNREKFASIVCQNGGYPKRESVGTTNDHYHIYFYVYEFNSKIVPLCPALEVGP